MGLCGNKGAHHRKLGWGYCSGMIRGCVSGHVSGGMFRVCVSANRTSALLIHLGPYKIAHAHIREDYWA